MSTVFVFAYGAGTVGLVVFLIWFIRRGPLVGPEPVRGVADSLLPEDPVLCPECDAYKLVTLRTVERAYRHDGAVSKELYAYVFGCESCSTVFTADGKGVKRITKPKAQTEPEKVPTPRALPPRPLMKPSV